MVDMPYLRTNSRLLIELETACACVDELLLIFQKARGVFQILSTKFRNDSTAFVIRRTILPDLADLDLISTYSTKLILRRLQRQCWNYAHYHRERRHAPGKIRAVEQAGRESHCLAATLLSFNRKTNHFPIPWLSCTQRAQLA